MSKKSSVSLFTSKLSGRYIFNQTGFIGPRGMWADCIVIRYKGGQGT